MKIQMTKKHLLIGCTILATIIFFIIGWQFVVWLQLEPIPSLPVYPDGQQFIIQKVDNNQKIITSFYVNDELNTVETLYNMILIRNGWDNPDIYRTDRYIFINRSRDIVIPGKFGILNNCPISFLSVSYEQVGNDQVKVTSVETVGPCGRV